MERVDVDGRDTPVHESLENSTKNLCLDSVRIGVIPRQPFLTDEDDMTAKGQLVERDQITSCEVCLVLFSVSRANNMW